MLKRRRSSDAMDEYRLETNQRRAEVMGKDAELQAVQKMDGDDNLEEWKRLKEEGAFTVSDSERDTDSSRLGSDGLIAERIDTKLPYVDQGYVASDQVDFMKEVGKLFGGGQKKKAEEG